MPRPKVCDEPRVATAVRLPESLHRRLHDAASERQVSANRLVTSALADYLARLPSVAQVTESSRSTELTDVTDPVAPAVPAGPAAAEPAGARP
jgi:hypothetical protein